MAKRSTRKALPKEWPAASSETRKVSDLSPYARNARTHSAAQIRKIAASIQEFGWTNPVLISEDDTIVAGHGRIMAAESMGIDTVPVNVARGWTEAQIRAYVIADNQLAIDAGWDQEVLALEVEALASVDFDLGLLGFGASELDAIQEHSGKAAAIEAADAAELPDVQATAVSMLGDVWVLGEHRVICGDSTRPDDVARLMGDSLADCIFSDPPYGMGKEAEGVLNDNLYREKLDDFQMKWIPVALGHSSDRASLYLWGNAPDLWRLWLQGGLGLDDDLHVRNEIVWDKGSGNGMKSSGGHSFAVASERCLFIMRGKQFLGVQNKDNYAKVWDPLRKWMVTQRDKAGWKNSDVNRLTGSKMAGHWFNESQFQAVDEDTYNVLRVAADGVAFNEDYHDLFVSLFPDLFKTKRANSEDYRRAILSSLRDTRTFFDNVHDSMTDVWRFNRVTGEDRFGHATPKPVAMVGRALRSSVPDGGLVLDPFLGTGTALVAADALGLRCYGLELEPAYVDVVIRRWEAHSGKPAKLEGSRSTFAAVSKRRASKK